MGAAHRPCLQTDLSQDWSVTTPAAGSTSQCSAVYVQGSDTAPTLPTAMLFGGVLVIHSSFGVITLQNRCALMLTLLGLHSRLTPLYQRLNWITFRNRVIFHKAVLVCKSLNGLVPD